MEEKAWEQWYTLQNSSNQVGSPTVLRRWEGPPTFPYEGAPVSYLLTKANLKNSKGEMWYQFEPELNMSVLYIILL